MRVSWAIIFIIIA